MNSVSHWLSQIISTKMKCRLRYCAECGYCITSLYVGLDVSDTQPICCSLQPEAGWIQIRIRSLTGRIIITWDVSCFVDTAVFGLVGRKKLYPECCFFQKSELSYIWMIKILIIIYFDNKNKKNHQSLANATFLATT